jgi:ATP-dependent Lhr-like helicase
LDRDDPGQDERDGLEAFLPAVGDWFRRSLGAPTDPQRRAWPEVAAGRHTLVCAPTGSGKTLAAFLACLDHLWRHPRTGPGVRLLYVSPLKALNEDIARNLEAPLAGIVAEAEARGEPLPPLRVAVRTGDTPPAERQRIARRPPDILITTPESLHLMLTSRAREGLRRVSHVVVDEIHALAPNKRGVFLALLLERLEAQNPASFVRIGLSATQRPLEEVARFLGGRRKVGPDRFEPRPVTLVDAGLRKALDLEVGLPATPVPGGSVWPAIEERLAALIDGHRSTIVFTNNRRVAERLTARLNEREELTGKVAEADDATAGDDAPPPAVVSHHGSLSLDRRRGVEAALKEGRIRAVVATASLELGIDMGAVDLVCQVESPGSVARGLQRVGRAGHLVGARSRGRLLAKTAGDLLESAALARAMTAGEVERLRVPTNCLDVLAQQVVACAAVDRPGVPALFDLVRGAYPYRDLSASAFEAVLELVSGRYAIETFRDLRPRVSWDRVQNALHPLPGTAQLALVGGGTIPDTGGFPLYLGDGGPRLGELDEEFVLERRVGETFVLGTATWRIEAIDPQRVVVAPAEGRSAMMPFWRGEAAHRTGELGAAVGALCRELAGRVDDPGVLDWLRSVYHLEDRSARTLRDHVARQVRLAGAVPDDRTVLVETFRDPAGERGLAVLSPWGGKLHHALKLALQASLRRRLGITPAALHDDEGVLIRLPQAQDDEAPPDLFEGLTPERAERYVREELADSALFGLRFRQNAGRALLLPRPDPGKRTPLWLQRLRAKDLLQAVRQLPDFPIVVETFRECLEDDLDLPRLRELLGGIAGGSVRVVSRRGEIPSPFASGLIFAFSARFLYEWDEPKRPEGGRGPAAPVALDALEDLLDRDTLAPWLDPAAIGRVEGRLREAGRPPRTEDEMAERLRRLGDLTESELFGPMAGFLARLEAAGRAARIALERTAEPPRWVDAEDVPVYRAAFGAACRVISESGGGEAGLAPAPPPDLDPEAARTTIVRRFLRTHALVGLADLTARYPIEADLAAEGLEAWAEAGQLVRVDPEGPDENVRWADRRNLQEVRRLAVALRRRESVAVAPEVFADFVLRRQHVAPSSRLEGSSALPIALEGLAGFAATADLLEGDFLPRRLKDYRPSWLDEALVAGGWTWRAGPGARGDLAVAVVPRGFAGAWPPPGEDLPALDPAALAVREHLKARGASFADDVAAAVGLPPGAARVALRGLMGRGLVANDRFDPVREGGDAATPGAGDVPRSPRGRPRLGALRRSIAMRPEGRWSAIEAGGGDGGSTSEASLLAWAEVLLARYGVLTRETAEADPWAPPWRELVPVLAAAELRGEVRRGYFVEGLSGVQYALSETVDALSRHAGTPDPEAAPVLVHSLDPANLYGAGAPLDIPLLEGGTARLGRNAGNYLVFAGGRPVLIVEGHGRRLTGLASASEPELIAATALVPTLAGPSRRVLKVETYNLAPTLASPAAPWLAAAGFVRDPPGMAFYAGWS